MPAAKAARAHERKRIINRTVRSSSRTAVKKALIAIAMENGLLLHPAWERLTNAVSEPQKKMRYAAAVHVSDIIRIPKSKKELELGVLGCL